MKKTMINGMIKFVSAVLIRFISDMMMLFGIIVMKLKGYENDEIVLIITRNFIEQGNFKYLVYFRERVKKFEELGLI